jgi:hypothetical protein
MNMNLKSSVKFGIITLILGAACGQPATDHFALKAQFVVGDVRVESAAGSRVPASGDAVNEADTVKTGANSQIDLVYGDQGFLRLQENSMLKIAELREKQGGGTGLDLERGKIFVMVSKLTKGSSFSVKTPFTLAAIRGTSFRVSADEKAARVDVVSGKVSVNPVREGRVVEEITAVVETNQVVELTAAKVEAVAVKKEEMRVQDIAPEVMTQIRNELKEVAPVVMQKLGPETVRELRQVAEPPAGDDALRQKKEEEDRARLAALAGKQQQVLAEKRRKDEALQREAEENANREKLAAEQAEKERVTREKAEKARREKEAKDRSSNIPTL